MSFRTLFNSPYRYGPNQGFDTPSGGTPIYSTSAEPDFLGASGGVSIYRGTESSVVKHGYPEVIGQDQLDYTNTVGQNDTVNYLMPAPGSSDLIMPRQAFGTPGRDRTIQSVGPVTGANTGYRDTLTPLNPANPGNAGPVVGGPDYSETVQQNYYAQLTAYSAEAANNSLLVSF